jgi:hypothetical protein
MRRELERIQIPGEHDARVQTWEVVRAAFGERETAARRRPLLRPALVAAAIAAVLAAALSPPGQAVLQDVRAVIGVADAEEAVFSLPAHGRLLVVASDGGDAYVVHSDGSRRRLGDFDAATWSPQGRFVLAIRRNGVFALTPKGEERWSLPRPDVTHATWGGTRTDTRVAYASRGELRVVAGDGQGDRRLDQTGGNGVAAWKPGGEHVLAYLDGSDRVAAVATDTRRVLWRTRPLEPRVVTLAWSADGRRVLAVSPQTISVFDERGRLVRALPMRAGSRALGAEFAPLGHVFALRVHSAIRSQVLLVNADRAMRPRQLFTGLGAFGDLAWSPDGRWLLLDWIDADQWVFVRTRGRPKIVAVSNIGPQLESSPRTPRLLDWCCP